MRWALPLTLLGLLGCDLNQLPRADPSLTNVCEQACLRADECGYCIEGEGGGCFTQMECVEWCRVEQEEAWGECFVEVEGCGEADLDACWNLKQNRCVSTCRFLERCGVCARDAAGECLDEAQCVLECLDFDDRILDCVRAFDECDPDHINACLTYAGSEACNASCSNLNLCGRCWPDGAGGCLDWNGCMSRCNISYDYTWTCLGGAECGVIDRCYGPRSLCHDACRRRAACAGSEEAACLEGCLLVEDDAWAACALQAADPCALEACEALRVEPSLSACRKMTRCRACFSEGGVCIEDAQCAEILTRSLPVYGACVYAHDSCDLRPCDDAAPPISCEVACAKADVCAAAGCAEACEGWASATRACLVNAISCDQLRACAPELASAP